MFEHFFLEFRIAVYPKIKTSPWARSDIVRNTLIPAAVLMLIMVVNGTKCGSPLFAVGGIGIFILAVICVWFWDRKYVEEHRKENRRIYVDEKLVLLINLLNDKEFDLYSPEKISYLIACCENSLTQQKEPEFPKLGAFGGFLSATIMVTFGALLEKIETEYIATVLSVLLVLIAIAWVLGSYAFLIKDGIQSPKRNALTLLKNELEYIRSKLMDEETDTTKEELTETQESIAVAIEE